MLKTIGVILVIYGAAGAIGTGIIYAALQGPMQQLRVLLQLLSKKIALSGDASRRAGSWVNLITPIFDQIAGLISKIVTSLRHTGMRFGEAASIVKSVESTLDTVQFPTLTPQMKTLTLDFSADAVSGVNLTEYTVTGFKVYGPPLTLDKTTIGFNLGELPVLTGITIEQTYPLQPVGDIFRFAGEKIEAAEEQIDAASDRVEQVRDHTLEAKAKVEKTSESIKDLAEKLDEASRDLMELSQNKVLSLVPALLLGYFGLIHMAIALTGVALLLK